MTASPWKEAITAARKGESQVALMDVKESSESLSCRPGREFAIMPASTAVVSDRGLPATLTSAHN
jgi:hypothetical protein